MRTALRFSNKTASYGRNLLGTLTLSPIGEIAIALIDNGFRFVSWVLFSCQFQWWNGRTEHALGTVS
jgi:hypothetical protein